MKQLKIMRWLFALLIATVAIGATINVDSIDELLRVGTVMAIAVAPIGAVVLTPAEKLAVEMNAKLETYKEMITKSATVEALKAAVDDFNDFKEKNDTAEYQTKISGLEKNIKELTDKVGKISIADHAGGKSLAMQIKAGLDTDKWKSHLDNRAEGESPIWQMKDIDWGAAGANGTNDVVQNAMPFEVPVYPFEEPFDVRSYIPVATVDSGSLDYPKELVYTDGMGTLGETGASSETSITFEMVTENAHRIATFAEVSRRALRNTAWLAQYLANRFMEKWVKLLNTEVLVGDGTGEHLNGIITQATAYAVAQPGYVDSIPTGESSLIDTIIAMKSQLYVNSNAQANACWVSPQTHYQLTVQKTTTRAYAYDQVLAQVDNSGIWRINGMALVMSKDIPVGDALIGMVSPNVLQLLMNGGLDMATTQSHSTNFVASLVAFRFEADVLFPIYRPYCFIEGTLSAVQADITASA